MISTQRFSLQRNPRPTMPPYAAFEMPRVLVIGSNSSEVRFLQRLLEVGGYWVDSATIGMASLVQSSAAVSGLFRSRSIELLVLDGAGEPELAVRLLNSIRETYPALPIILIAGSDPEVRKEARRLGIDIVLDAPATIADLRRAAQELAPLFPEPSPGRSDRTTAGRRGKVRCSVRPVSRSAREIES